MHKKAVFPGSFDPVTKGHESLVRRSAPLFDEIIVAVGENVEKKYLFSLNQRMQWLEKVFADLSHVKVTHYSGLTVDFCEIVGASYILRGLRTAADFEFERGVGQTNKRLNPKIETVFLLTTAELTPITSSIVRDVYRNNGDISSFIPDSITIP